MECLLKDMITYLQANQCVVGDGVDAFRDYVPDTPDDVVVLQEYAGLPIAAQVPDFANRSVQILVRSKTAKEARTRAWQVFKSLNKPDQYVQFTEERFGMVYLRQSPFKIKIDKNNRVYFGFNLGVSTTID